jgi:hypothetical protein
VLGTAAPAFAQSVLSLQFDPLVIPASGVPTARLMVAVQGQPTQVVIRLQVGTPREIELRDDGTQGDSVSGDRVFTATLAAADIVAALRDDDVQRVFVGFVDLRNGPVTAQSINTFVDVRTSRIPETAITRLAQDVQSSAHLVNINDPAYFTDGSATRVAQRFYQFFGDDYDFLNLISTPDRVANRNHGTVKNEVEGIGLNRSDASATFGSGGRLLGINRFPIPTFYDGASIGYAHEHGHQWINFLNFFPFASGVPHWPISSMASGLMGFSIGGMGGQGGTFACYALVETGGVRLVRPDGTLGFTDLDLYLMGLLPPNQVRDQVVFPDQTAAAITTLLGQCDGRTYSGPVIRVTVQDLVAQLGPRRPDASQSPKAFRSATIFVTRDGLLNAEAMWQYDWFSSRAALQSQVPIHDGFLKRLGHTFFTATGGRASIDPTISSAPARFDLTPTPGAVTVPRGEPAIYTISVMPTAGSFDAAVDLACGVLPGNATCAFAPQRVVPGSTGADVRLTISTRRAAASAAVVGLAAITFACLVVSGSPGRRAGIGWSAWRLGLLTGSLTAAAACGGGSGNSPLPPSTSTTTPPGMYSVVVTGTSGIIQRSVSVTLTVQ